ncbi:hypothetical protein GUJ93_ZPchr0012g20372 [Zizania palustris]|uniref:Uncharacterized protein n=1 Tax=Zizania palustris TaxID=103762 RepID=A0A8J5WRG3_ZIZPA|nr:hypothetical protein GUJ93_ZPchr0012g20418 [Zizania palustris]KAG8095191.1 hypothetical protein GUJ93_ZPchr0012g20372 [Zizania palustris]
MQVSAGMLVVPAHGAASSIASLMGWQRIGVHPPVVMMGGVRCMRLIGVGVVASPNDLHTWGRPLSAASEALRTLFNVAYDNLFVIYDEN